MARIIRQSAPVTVTKRTHARGAKLGSSRVQGHRQLNQFGLSPNVYVTSK